MSIKENYRSAVNHRLVTDLPLVISGWLKVDRRSTARIIDFIIVSAVCWDLPLPFLWYYRILGNVPTVLPWNYPYSHGNYRGITVSISTPECLNISVLLYYHHKLTPQHPHTQNSDNVYNPQTRIITRAWRRGKMMRPVAMPTTQSQLKRARYVHYNVHINIHWLLIIIKSIFIIILP